MRGPFRATEAIAGGLVTASQLRSSVWRRLFPGIVVAADIAVTPMLLIRAASLWLPADAAFTGRSAARAWGVEFGDASDPVEVICPRRIRSTNGVAVRVSRLDADETSTYRGLRVTTPLHTAWEIARARPEAEAVGWVDGLARRRHLAPADLCTHATRHVGEMGSRRAGATLTLADSRAESPPESHLRVAIVRGGLPAPVPQFSVIVRGYFIARVDLAWPAWRFAVEYDGQWHADRGQLHRDRTRVRELNAAGWYVYPVTREDMYDLPRLIGHIGALLTLRRNAIESRSATL
jgi:hypothetical protein